jgi:hypothetical protein
VRFKTDKDGDKIRVFATTGEQIGEPVRSAESKKRK